MDSPQERPTRRIFLDRAIKGGITIWAGAMAAPTVVYLWPARAGGGRAERVSAGPAKDFAVGSAKFVQASGRPILVIRRSEERFRAFSAVCTHLGCVVKWDGGEQKIRCPCHAAVFDADGRVLAGPPPRPLPGYDVSVVGSEVFVKL